MESQGQGQHQEGKRNFNKKKWRETQYSHKQRVNLADVNNNGMGEQKKRSREKKVQKNAEER
uniref:Uncharacterized protein n=1 Tax=Daphnia galeata TaxID=27404 RepID=A0A8J2RXD1_9CRUS|nr:unnamed protein product [Daphnia galeata]